MFDAPPAAPAGKKAHAADSITASPSGATHPAERHALLTKYIELSDAESVRAISRVEHGSSQLKLQVIALQDRLDGASPHSRRKLRFAALGLATIAPLLPGVFGRLVSSVPVIALWLHQ